MGQSFEDLLEQLVDARDAKYRDEPERDEARLRTLESVMQTMLEKLRDIHDRR